MEMIALVVAFGAIMWYLIDRAKPLWAELSFGKYVTMGVALALGVFFTFAFGLDIVSGLGLSPAQNIYGQIVTVFALMSGSSGIAEIMERVAGKKQPDLEK